MLFAGNSGRSQVRFLAPLALVACCALPATRLAADDAYHQTLLRPREITSFESCPLLGGRAGRPRPTVVMADQPRQAALLALKSPHLGVEMAGNALSAGMDADRQDLATCVDLYFEAVVFSWHFLKSPGATGRPEYETAWQLYHAGLTRLISSGQRFGRLDATRGLQLVTASGPQVIPTSHHNFVWKPGDFTRVEVVTDSTPRQLSRRYRCAGLGVPLVVVREPGQPDRFLNDATPFVATAVLRPSLEALAGLAAPRGASSSHGPLEFHDPLRVKQITAIGHPIALAGDASAALEYAVKNTTISPWQGVVRPGTETQEEKLYMVEPYQRGKFPIVFVHGYHSSPVVWAQIANEIQTRPELQQRFQLWAYRYPTGKPFLRSAAILRAELEAAVAAVDPLKQDPALRQMVVIGHSMGGLVAKLLVTHSDDRIWSCIANRPLEELNATAEQKDRLRELAYFKPLPFVRRVVFMGTPHGGIQVATRCLGELGSRGAVLPAVERVEHGTLVRNNPDVFRPQVRNGIPNSIDLMDPQSEVLQAIQGLSPGANVQFHNIIGTGCPSPLAGASDGVVAVKSAKQPCVSSERFIPTTHGRLHEVDEAIEEIECILRRHIWESEENGWALPETPREPAVGTPTPATLPTGEPVMAEQPPVTAPDRTHSCLVSPDSTSPVELGPAEVSPDSTSPAEIGPDSSSPVEIGSVEIGPDSSGPVEVNSAEVNPDGSSRVKVNSVEVNPDSSGPVEVGPELFAPDGS